MNNFHMGNKTKIYIHHTHIQCDDDMRRMNQKKEKNDDKTKKNKHLKKVNNNQADATLRLFGFIK